jgi:hypothetical protein
MERIGNRWNVDNSNCPYSKGGTEVSLKLSLEFPITGNFRMRRVGTVELSVERERRRVHFKMYLALYKKGNKNSKEARANKERREMIYQNARGNKGKTETTVVGAH